MQEWIPVVSSSLYFWTSVVKFSGRQYFEIRWGFYIKVKVSWLRAFLWCVSQTSRDQDNSRRVRTHEKDSGETVRWVGTIIKSIFLPNQKPASAWIFGNSSVRVGTQELFCPYQTNCPWVTHAWVAFKRRSSMKSPCGILWKGVLEPLTHVCTDLKISKESNVLIQVIVMW